MDDGSRILTGILGCLASLMLMGFLTACESAVTELNDAKLKKNAQTDAKAKKLLRLVSKPNRLMMASSVSRSFMIAAFSVIAQIGFFYPIVNAVTKAAEIDYGSSAYYGVCIGAAFAIILVSAFVISTLGLILPRRAVGSSDEAAEKFAYAVVGEYNSLLKIWIPFEAAASALVNGILKLFGVKNLSGKDAVTEEEILLMVDAVNETGAIEESQSEMIKNVFEFDDLEVSDVMTHRTSIHAVEINDPVTIAVKIATEDGFSRIPVYQGNIDKICGAVFAKDLLKASFEKDGEQMKISGIMRDIMYVPETKNCGELFEEFTAHRNQIAVVVDEYGGTAGIVTMEDLVEAIVGNIRDEYDNEEEEIDEITPNTFDLLGTAGFEDVMEKLGIEYDGEGDYDTIGAFIVDILGRFPEENERATVTYKDVTFVVISVNDNKIKRVRAFKAKETEKDE